MKTDGNGTASYLVIKGAELFRQPEIQHFHDQLEVEVEAAGVEVGGAEQGVFAVDEQEFGVGEGRGLAVNLHAPVRQHGHLVAHGPVHKAVVVLAGQDDAHVHAAQDRAHQLAVQTVRRQEVRAHDPHGMPRRRNLGADEIEDGVLGGAGAVHEDAAQ